MCIALCMCCLVCGLCLASLDAGDTPATPLNTKTLVVATDRLSCAAPCVSTALYVHCLVYVLPCMWTTARFAQCGGHGPPFVCSAFCEPRLVSAPPCVCAALYVDYGSLRLMRETPPATPLNNKTFAVATDRLSCAAPCVSTALYVHRLVYVLPCMWTMARFARRRGHPRNPPKYQDSCGGHGPPFVCSALCEHSLVCALPCVCAALYVDYGSLRSMQGTRTAFCVQRLL